jgi:hypothetical protein
MSPDPAPRRLVEVSGAEAFYLLEGSRTGRLVHIHRDAPLVRPATHVLEYGRLIVRTPVPEAMLGPGTTVTYDMDEIRTVIGTGWSVTATGPGEPITDLDEPSHPQFRLARAEP